MMRIDSLEDVDELVATGYLELSDEEVEELKYSLCMQIEDEIKEGSR